MMKVAIAQRLRRRWTVTRASERRFFGGFPFILAEKHVFLLFFDFFSWGKYLYSQNLFSWLRNVPVSVFNEPNFFLNTATTALIDKRGRAEHSHGASSAAYCSARHRRAETSQGNGGCVVKTFKSKVDTLAEEGFLAWFWGRSGRAWSQTAEKRSDFARFSAAKQRFCIPPSGSARYHG